MRDIPLIFEGEEISEEMDEYLHSIAAAYFKIIQKSYSSILGSSYSPDSKKAKFEFHIKRAVVNMDDLDDDIKDDVIKSLALIKKGQFEKAIAALPPLNFEWIWSNGDGDPSEFFTDTEDLTISLTPENSSIRVGETDGNLVLTVAIQFELDLVENCNTDEINDWLSDNSMFFCGYIGCGWTYHGDDGGGITMLS